MGRRIAVWPTGEQFQVAVFDDGILARFTVPRPAGRLHGGMRPCTLLFEQRDLPEARLGPAIAVSLATQPGKHFHQTVDAVRPRRVGGPVVGLMDAPPRAGVASRERDAVVLIRGGINDFESFGGRLGNRPASSSVPSDAPMVLTPTQPSLLYRCDVAVVGRVDRVGLGDVVQRVVPTPTPGLHAFQDQGHDGIAKPDNRHMGRVGEGLSRIGQHPGFVFPLLR